VIIVFDSGKLKIRQKIPEKSESGRPIFTLKDHSEAFYGDINFTVEEYYIAQQSGTRVDRRVRIYQNRAVCDKFVFEIGGVQYDVGRVWHGKYKGVEISDVTLALVVAKYEEAKK
jgi:SPP1 family predicted phage head-tail adaptor